MGSRIVALPFGVWLLGALLVLGMLPLLGFVPFMPEALQFHFMGGLELGKVLGVTGCWLNIVEVVLQGRRSPGTG